MKNKTLYFFRFIEMFAGTAIISLGLTFMIKSGLGQTSAVAFTQNMCKLLYMKSGTFLIIFNMSCVGIQMLLLKKDFQKLQFLQLFIAWLQGVLVNVFCYEFPYIASMRSDSYVLSWCWMIFGILLTSFGVAVLMNADLVKQPFEELCRILAERWKVRFSNLRVAADMVFMAVSLLLIVCFHLDFSTLREGTWVCMVLLGKSMVFTFPLARRLSLSVRYHQEVKSLS